MYDVAYYNHKQCAVVGSNERAIKTGSMELRSVAFIQPYFWSERSAVLVVFIFRGLPISFFLIIIIIIIIAIIAATATATATPAVTAIRVLLLLLSLALRMLLLIDVLPAG